MSQRRPPIIQHPRHVMQDNFPPPSYIGTQYGRDPYVQDRHVDRRYMDGIRADAAYGRFV
jgi:hypothetical protein